MSFTETTRTSWFSRLKSGVPRIFIGLILVVASVVLLFWNEGRSVKTYRSLNEGAGLVVSIESGTIDPVNNGRLIHISGPAKAIGTPRDPMFGVAADGAVRLQRRVEMFQWVESKSSETRTTLGGEEETVTTYSYNKEWRQGRVNSNDFRQAGSHSNPPLPAESDMFTVQSGTVGAFAIDGSTLANLGTRSAIILPEAEARRIGSVLGSTKRVAPQGDTILVSNNPDNFQVGDLRISFSRLDVSEASVVGAQRDATLLPYKTLNGRSLFLAEAGLVPAPEMFATAQSENTIITWIVRAAGLVCLFIGFALMFSLLGIIADVIPFIGSIVSFGTSLFALVLTLLIGPLVMAIAWFAYRPLLSLAILAAGAAIAGAVLYIRRRKPGAETGNGGSGPGFGRNAAT